MAQKKSGAAGNRPAASARAGGRSGRALTIAGMAVGAIVIVTIFFSASLWALNRFFPQNGNVTTPKLAALPPLPPLTRSSYVIAPVAVALTRNPQRARKRRAARSRRQERQSGEQPAVEGRHRRHRQPRRHGGHGPAGRPDHRHAAQRRVAPHRPDRDASRQSHRRRSPGCSTTASASRSSGLTSRVLDQRADIRGNVLVTARPR